MHVCYSRLENNLDLSDGARSLVKRGPLVFTRVNKGKVTGSKKIQCFLFTDLFMYAKKIKGKKDYLVYKQLHRSLIGVADVDPHVVGKKKGHFFEITLFGETPTRLLVDAKTKKTKAEWMDILVSKHTTGTAYEEWDCPRAVVTQSYNPQQRDEVALREGDTVDVLIRNKNGRAKGRVLRNTEFGMLVPVAEGWFPVRIMKEIQSAHSQAKVFKRQFQRDANTFTRTHK
eukprot:m.174392 g.174392  ORF g.174392 m.174392 type:complete len:229 (+) comp13505_c9_seq4:1928-2614(+)